MNVLITCSNGFHQKMNLRLSSTVMCLMLVVAYAAQAQPSAVPRRQVAVTFDDLPMTNADGQANRKLLASISANQVPATGFVNENKLYVRGEKNARIVAMLRMWLDAGIELGNHTFSHISIDRNSLAAYQEDVIRGETVTRLLLREKGMKLKYFRHPQLRTGPTQDYKKGLHEFLAGRGYTVAPVTIDNQEWVFAAAYAGAKTRGEATNMKRIGDSYLKHMEEVFDFFERLSADFLGYEIKQTLLLHANALNADYFDELVRLIRKRGYAFISLDEALKDQAYRLPEAQSARGLSWLHRWMLAKGMTLRPEPREPAWVMNLLRTYSRR